MRTMENFGKRFHSFNSFVRLNFTFFSVNNKNKGWILKIGFQILMNVSFVISHRTLKLSRPVYQNLLV